MKQVDKVMFSVLLVLFLGIVGMSVYGRFFLSNDVSYVSSHSGDSLLTGAVVGLNGIDVQGNVSSVVECWSFGTQTACNNNGSLGCRWNTNGNFCERWACYNADTTNQTFCETTLKTSFNQSCTWTAGTSSCNPVGGGFFGSGCSDFNGNSNGCFNAFSCVWNSSSSLCITPSGGFGQQAGSNNNPGCRVLTDQKICNGISGCLWDSGFSTCNGNDGGMSCSLLNKTMCPDFTLFSTCCGWSGTNCTTSFDKGCYSKTPSFPIGGTFCEDYKAFTNQTLCQLISTTPYYMPCKWDNVTNQCHFNSIGFGGTGGGSGGGAKFDEISTELGCKSVGGTWKSQQYMEGSGSTKTDTWCEFNFGFSNGGAGGSSGSGNCDSACWACETGVSSTKGNTTAQARSYCENSAVGYCEFKADSTAANKLGWCNPKMSFVEGGAKSCNDVCGSCAFMKNPQSQCQNSTKGCVWSSDANAANGVGNCYGKSEKYCGTDCFSCYDSSTCTFTGKGGGGACTWDVASSFCKPAGFNGEVCFDGKDNDNNGVTDCADPGCSNDKFCGGEDLAAGFNSDCPSFTSNATCISNKCQWSKSMFENNFGGSSGGHCDFPGAQCGILDEQFPCAATQGCSWSAATANTCGKNGTLFNSCFPQNNQTNCEVVGGCGWSFDHFNSSRGRCEPVVFSQCFSNETRFQSQTLCESNMTVKGISTQVCGWSADPFSPTGGRCGPSCFTRPGTAQGCQDMSAGLCAVTTGYCAPRTFGGNCNVADGNKTRCESEFNSTCSFFSDFASNNNQNISERGWCKAKSEGKVFGFMGDTPPSILGSDGNEAAINNSWDLDNIGLRDDFDRLVLGANVIEFSRSATCNGTVLADGTLGAGSQNYTFFWYVDSDGNTTNHCASRDNSSIAGFEFSFKYQATWGASRVERTASYQCVNASWGPVPVPLVSMPQKMCSLIQGGMAAVGKKDLYKFRDLYNKSKDLRLYTTVGDAISVVNESRVNDTAGPYFYSQGSFDFKFEDCSNPGGDADGDGLIASNDPDCTMFQKFGYVPNEGGFQCGDAQDNDGDGKMDCADEGCTFETICGGTGNVVKNALDKSAPKITWFQVDTFPDGGFLKFDTNEPANGTILFYGINTTCSLLNKTVVDDALLDDSADYKIWHTVPIDNFDYNSQRVGALANATSYFYKTTVCDINGNCAVSACSNFTTKALLSGCKGCAATFTFPFTAKLGSSATDPMGDMVYKFEFPTGGSTIFSGNAGTGAQLNSTSMRRFNLIIENPNATNTSHWRVKFINASLTGKVATSTQNFTAGSDFQFNTTSNTTANIKFVGMSTSKCQDLINTFRPKKLEIGLPGNYTTEFWQCSSGALGNCTNRASGAANPFNGSYGSGYFNATLNMSLWQVPTEWGC